MLLASNLRGKATAKPAVQSPARVVVEEAAHLHDQPRRLLFACGYFRFGFLGRQGLRMEECAGNEWCGQFHLPFTGA
jgi:hypothetical protein